MAEPKSTSLTRILAVFAGLCVITLIAGFTAGSCTPKPKPPLPDASVCPTTLANDCRPLQPGVQPPPPASRP